MTEDQIKHFVGGALLVLVTVIIVDLLCSIMDSKIRRAVERGNNCLENQMRAFSDVCDERYQKKGATNQVTPSDPVRQ